MARIVTSPVAVVVSSPTGATFRIAPRVARNQAVVEVLDVSGQITQVRCSSDDMRRLAAALMKVAALLESSVAEEATQP